MQVKNQEELIAEFDKIMQTDMGRKFLLVYDGYKTENERLQKSHDELVKIAEQLGEGLDPFAAWEVLDHTLRTLKSAQREKELFKTAYDTMAGGMSCLASMLPDGEDKDYANNLVDSMQSSIVAETIDLAPNERWATGSFDPIIPLYSYVEKWDGEARWFGQVRATYTTDKGKIRHVVNVIPQGFQMIAVPRQLRIIPKEQLPEYINVNEGEINAGLKYVEAEIFSDDEHVAHRASSPKQVVYARHEKREGIMRYIRFWKGRGK